MCLRTRMSLRGTEPWGKGQPPLTTTHQRKKTGFRRENPRTRSQSRGGRTGLLPKVTPSLRRRRRSTVKSFLGETGRDRQTCRMGTRLSSWRKWFWSPPSRLHPPPVKDRHTAVIPARPFPRKPKSVPDCRSSSVFLSCSPRRL